MVLSPEKIKLRRTIKNLKLKHKNLTKNIDLKDLLKKHKHLINPDAREFIQMQHEGDSAFLIENEKKNKGRKSCGSRYSEQIKSFELTLQYYSPKAYNYVRFDFSYIN